MYCIRLAQGGDKWLPFVNIIIHIQIPQNVKRLWPTHIVTFQTNNLPHYPLNTGYGEQFRKKVKIHNISWYPNCKSL